MGAVADEIHGRSRAAASRRLKEMDDEERRLSREKAYGYEGKTVGEIIEESYKKKAERRRLEQARREDKGGTR